MARVHLDHAEPVSEHVLLQVAKDNKDKSMDIAPGSDPLLLLLNKLLDIKCIIFFNSIRVNKSSFDFGGDKTSNNFLLLSRKALLGEYQVRRHIRVVWERNCCRHLSGRCCEFPDIKLLLGELEPEGDIDHGSHRLHL